MNSEEYACTLLRDIYEAALKSCDITEHTIFDEETEDESRNNECIDDKENKASEHDTIKSPTENSSSDKDNILMDFSCLFSKKKKKVKKCRPKEAAVLGENKNIENVEDFKDENIIQVEEEIKKQEMKIAENLTITQEQMKIRRYMDIRRW